MASLKSAVALWVSAEVAALTARVAELTAQVSGMASKEMVNSLVDAFDQEMANKGLSVEEQAALVRLIADQKDIDETVAAAEGTLAPADPTAPTPATPGADPNALPEIVT